MKSDLRIQSIIYKNDTLSLKRALDNILIALEKAYHEDLLENVELVYGDASPSPVFSNDEIAALQQEYSAYMSIRYVYFNCNTGTAKGHNMIAENCEKKYMMIMNPDVMLCPDFFLNAFIPFGYETTGVVEARQTPVEHPKEYDVFSGETAWASTACTIFPTAVFRQVNGFDADTFFMYCDDLDFSWRVRLTGKKIIYQPSAFVFHAKRVSKDGKWQATSTEKYYSAEASLLMAYKWSNEKLADLIIKNFLHSGDPDLKKAANSYLKRKDEGNLPEQLDPQHKVATFVNGNYTNHRYLL